MKYNSYLSPSSAFVILLFVRALSAFFSNISDCDETFNYWEPVRGLRVVLHDLMPMMCAYYTGNRVCAYVLALDQPLSKLYTMETAWSSILFTL